MHKTEKIVKDSGKIRSVAPPGQLSFVSIENISMFFEEHTSYTIGHFVRLNESRDNVDRCLFFLSKLPWNMKMVP